MKPKKEVKKALLSAQALKEVERIQPLADRIVVEPQQGPEKIGSIIVPDSAKEGQKPACGHVVACGGGSREQPMALQIGDRITYPKYAGSEIELDGKTYLIMRETDVFALVAEEAIIR